MVVKSTPQMDWHTLVAQVAPHVVRISTPTGHGTGFLRYREGNTIGVATAAHVVRDAHEWERAVRIHHEALEHKSLVLRPGNRLILIHDELDIALILGRLQDQDGAALPNEAIKLVSLGNYMRRGVAVGWLGYPYLVENGTKCCFFQGNVSAFSDKRYYIDGAAVQGVSGGPTFCIGDSGNIIVIGCISTYKSSRETGGIVPGLLVADDVSKLQELDGIPGGLAGLLPK